MWGRELIWPDIWCIFLRKGQTLDYLAQPIHGSEAMISTPSAPAFIDIHHVLLVVQKIKGTRHVSSQLKWLRESLDTMTQGFHWLISSIRVYTYIYIYVYESKYVYIHTLLYVVFFLALCLIFVRKKTKQNLSSPYWDLRYRPDLVRGIYTVRSSASMILIGCP